MKNDHHLMPGSLNHIQVCAKTYTMEQRRIIINAIEHKSNKLYYSWLLILASLEPTPSDRVQEVCRIDTPTKLKYNYKNPTNRNLIFEIGTSHPDLIMPVEETLPFRELQGQNIEFNVAPQSEAGQQIVYAFITDLDNFVMDCVEIELTFAFSTAQK